MTGKEALEELLATLKHWQGRNTIFDKMQSDCILKELDELAKYQRAFEIFKNTNKITIQKLDWQTIDYLLRVDDLGFKLTKEEYELLKELINNESK